LHTAKEGLHVLEVALEKRLLFDKGAEEREQEEHRLQLQQKRMVGDGFVILYFGGFGLFSFCFT
jgi:hypothetical protein